MKAIGQYRWRNDKRQKLQHRSSILFCSASPNSSKPSHFISIFVSSFKTLTLVADNADSSSKKKNDHEVQVCLSLSLKTQFCCWTRDREECCCYSSRKRRYWKLLRCNILATWLTGSLSLSMSLPPPECAFDPANSFNHETERSEMLLWWSVENSLTPVFSLLLPLNGFGTFFARPYDELAI